MVDYFTKMEIHIKVCGMISKQMELENIKLSIKQILEDIGKMINKINLVWKNGQKEVHLLEIIKKEIKMVLE